MKREVPSIPSRFMAGDQGLYASILPELLEVISGGVDESSLRPTKGKVYKLMRYSGRTPLSWPIKPWITCSYPLYLYSSIVHTAGQYISAKDLVEACSLIASKVEHLPKNLQSDAFRAYLKNISTSCFPKVFTRGPAYMLFVHLHWLTAKCPYTEQQIIDDIEEWISDNIQQREKHLNANMVEKVLDRVFSTWYSGEPEGYLPFEDYANDFVRWGTSGGAPKVQMNGQSFRSKWAWSLYHSTDQTTGALLDNYDLYAQALRERTTSTIALKEEPAKTREIITTTMGSYLRQSYLMYRWGSPRIPSPISSATWQGKFERMNPTWFGSVDGERFDHCIPKSFITGIIRRLGDMDEDTRLVAEEELKHMDDLKVTWGDKVWKWDGGLLSGWRITSVIGSLASCCVAEYILEELGILGAVSYGVMGDDLILYSYTTSVDSQKLVEKYNEFGLKANLDKTSSGPIGEFLKRVISKGGTWAYPALGLRSACYANPWLDHYSYNEETEVSNVWMTVISRMLPHVHGRPRNLVSTCLRHCKSNLTQLFGKHDWDSWLRTPISAGGGGCSELSDVSRWVLFDKVVDINELGQSMFMKGILGVIPYKRVLKRNPTMYKMDLSPIIVLKDELQGTSGSPPDTWFKHHVNITRTIYDYIYGRISNAELRKSLSFSLPRGLRTTSPQRVIAFLMQGPKLYSGITTIQHTKESTQMYTGYGQYALRAISNSKRYRNIRYIQAAITLYMTQLLRSVYIPYGTW